MGRQKRESPSLRRMSRTELFDRLEALQSPSVTALASDAREAELQAVLHELEVHRFELEMQNRELQESRQALEESHDRFVNLFDFAPVGYVTLNDQGLIQEINLTAAAMIGIERRWLIGKSLAPWMFGTDLAALRTHLKACVQGGETVRSVLRLERKDKRTVPVEFSSQAFKDVATGSKLIRTTISDLTLRREVEEERDRFFELSGDLLCVISVDGRFERLNPAWTRTLGHSYEVMLAHPWIDFVHPDDREGVVKELGHLRSGKNSEGRFQVRILKADRTFVWLAWTVVRSGSLLFGVARDSTQEVHERARNESRYSWLADLIQSLPVPLMLAEVATGALVSMNAEADKLLNGYPRGVLSDQTQTDFFFTDTLGKRLEKADWPRFRAARGEILNGEELIWHAHGSKMHLLVWSRIISAKYDRPDMVIVMHQNIDALKAKEAALSEAVSLLQHERALREAFVSALTHDLRTPLTSARVCAELLRRPGLDAEKTSRLTENILRSVDRTTKMIGDLLDANRIRAGEALTIASDQMDLVPLVGETIGELSAIHGPLFEVKAPQAAFGYWNRNELRRVIENLVNNAVKYGSREQVITVAVAQEDASHVSIGVHNFGNPIPKSEQALLFDPFHRAKIAESGNQRGWGIGLTLVRGIIEAHGGQVKVSSSAKRGTKFTVVLPCGAAGSGSGSVGSGVQR